MNLYSATNEPVIRANTRHSELLQRRHLSREHTECGCKSHRILAKQSMADQAKAKTSYGDWELSMSMICLYGSALAAARNE